MFGKSKFLVPVIMGLTVLVAVQFTPANGALIDYSELSLSQGGFTYFTSAGGGQFDFNSSGVKLLTLQSGGSVVASGVITSVVASQANLVSDDSAGGEVDGTLMQGDGATAHTLTYIGYLYSGGQAPYNDSQNVQTLMIAQATGQGEIAEVPSSVDNIQVQYHMTIVGGGLFDGSAGHTMFSDFDTTYTFDASLAAGVAPTDLASDISFGQGDSSILINPEPVSISLFGIGALGLLRIRKRA